MHGYVITLETTASARGKLNGAPRLGSPDVARSVRWFLRCLRDLSRKAIVGHLGVISTRTTVN